MKNFLKTAAHQHKDPQVRIGYINDLSDNNDDAQKILTGLARNDDDLTVRVAAIHKLDDLNSLRELLNTNGDNADTVADAAENRLVQKFNEGSVSDIAVRALLGSHASRLAVPIAAQTVIGEQREMALAAIEDEASLVMVVQQSRFHDTRMAAAMRLSQHDALRTALTAVRSKDKVVAKQLQQRLDAEAAAEAALISRRHDVSSTLKAVQGLNQGLWTPQHGGRLMAAREKWAALEHQDKAESAAEFDAALAEAEARLVAFTKDQEDRNAQLADNKDSAADSTASSVATEPADPLGATSAKAAGDSTGSATEGSPTGNIKASVPRVDDPALLPVLETLKPCALSTLAPAIESVQNAQAAESSENVKKVLAYASSIAVLFDPPYEINKARPGALKARIKRVTALTDVGTLLPGIELSNQVYVAELSAHLEQLRDRLGKATQESSDRIKATHRQFAALSGIVKEGKWGPANSMMRRLQKKLSVMEPGERVSLDEKLVRAEQQLAEMADWQDFAARPKLEALCVSMEGLPAQTLEPEALAKHVRELQSEWKGLGVSRASNDLWARFKAAGDTAYEPCKVWFDEKQKERQGKLDAKAELCASLEAQHSSLAEDPDWKAIVKLVNNAKRDWSKNRVFDRKPDKALEARFSAALKPFEGALTEQYSANAEAKQALVEKVAALAGNEITQHSANQAKSLLSAWKLVGIMRRKEDQALWDAFNGHLGTIFKHQHQVKREKERAGLEHVFRAKDIIKKLKQLSRADTADESEIQTLSTEFQALAEFPERDKKFLLRDFRQAMDACSRVQENASRRRLEAEFEERQRLVGLCEQLELAVEQPDAVTETLVDDVAHAWDSSDARVSAEIASLLEKRRDQALHYLKESSKPDYAANEAQRRDLLIRMEVAAGVDTPAEDKARRMQYQLKNLQEGMTSSGVSDKQHVLSALELEWIAAGPANRAVSGALQSRFLKAYRR